MATAQTDVLVVSVPTTPGWRASATALVESLNRIGAPAAAVSTGPIPDVRTFALTDLVQARAARRAAARALRENPNAAVIYCSMTAALLWPAPGAVWLDSVAAENRPGRHGIWQRPVERRRLNVAPVVLAMSPRALQALPPPRAPVVVVPTPVEPSGPPVPRDIAALVYAANPEKRRLAFVLAAWEEARRGDERLVVAGLDGVEPRPGIEAAGRLSPEAYRALLRRCRLFIAAPTREDFGIAPLEALADGCMLVTTPAAGAYPALELARELDPRLVTNDLPTAIRTALDSPVAGYAARAAQLLEPYHPQAVDRALARDVLPRLLPGWRAA